MLRLARFLTLLLGFAGLQLTLLRGGVGCPMPTAGAMHAMAAAAAGSAAQSGAAMREMPGGMTDMAPDESTGRHGLAAEHGAPCDESAAPAQCQSMAPCLTAMVLSGAPAERPVPRAPAFVVAAVVLTPPSFTSPPDLPPPRA